MQVRFNAADLLLASWRVPPEAVERAIPRGLDPALVEGESALVSIAVFRNTDVRVNGHRAPSFSQVNIRTYVNREGEPAVYFLSLRATTLGLGGIFYGLPVRPASIRARSGEARASGLGVSFRYRPSAGEEPPSDLGLLGSHDIGYIMAGGLRRIVAEHEPFRWVGMELTDPPRLDPLLALGFDVREPDSLLYAESTAFRFVLPPQRVG